MNAREILGQLAGGEISIDEAESRLSLAGLMAIGEFALLDTGRQSRKGVPEVVFAPGKTTGQLIPICEGLLRSTGKAIVANVSADQWEALEDRFQSQLALVSREAKTMVLRAAGGEPQRSGGKIGILSAGTADIPASDQARIIAEEMGCEVIRSFDVGVAGVHRLVKPLGGMIENSVAAIVVAAGMEGALPSVVAGLVPVPVIGLPTSTGYGLGGGGVAALLAMLQSCCPGMVVVNIDNGVGAGATAALIANRCAAGA